MSCVKMTLHVFNPDHDIALAANLDNFTPPRAGRELHRDLGWLPVLWAESGDIVYTMQDDVSTSQMAAVTHVEPWGWDRALLATLLRKGVRPSVMPTVEQVEVIRQLSHRRNTIAILSSLRKDFDVLLPLECTSMDEAKTAIATFGHAVLKSPWSSSGRGVRFVSDGNVTNADLGWMKNVISLQGSVMVEKRYSKILDFGMEFHAEADGSVCYSGLSLFVTSGGAYVGNVLATETAKRKMLDSVAVVQVDKLQEMLCSTLATFLACRYSGPLGVDMMVMDGGTIHPCVEVNLRRTMGHVALHLSPSDGAVSRVMKVVYTGKDYKLIIDNL